MPLYSDLGFFSHPFSKTNADEEPDLGAYFVPPPYFDAVVGDASSPSASVVFAPRGAGKTALRRMVERYAIENRFLAVTYDRFEFGANQVVDDIGLSYHMRNIITRTLVAFLSYASDYPDIIKSFSKSEKRQLALFVQTYLGDLTGEKIQELLKELQGVPERLRKFWSTHVGWLDPIVNFVLTSNDLPRLDLPDADQEQKNLSGTYKHQLEVLVGFVQRIGFKSIYMLVDKPDETEQTSSDPEATYKLIRSMLRDLELLSISGCGFKFFLWDQVEPYYREDARPDRVAQYELNWSRKGLKRVLSKRLEFFSRSKVNRFSDLVCGNNLESVDDSICLMANGSPRNVIRICEKVFANQAERSIDQGCIDPSSIDQGVVSFSETVFLELYGQKVLREIQRVGRELFTISYVANDVLRISSQAAGTKISGWSKLGLVDQVGSVMVPHSKRPVNVYCVVDPVGVRLINRTVPFDRFISDRWIPCDHCSMDNLVDIDLVPGDNAPTCRKCGRDLL